MWLLCQSPLSLSLGCCFFSGIRLFLKENEADLIRRLTHLGPPHTYWVESRGLRKDDFPRHSVETKKEPSRNDGRESAWKQQPSPSPPTTTTGSLLPAPGIKSKSVRLWQAAPGSTPALPAGGPEGRVTGKLAAAQRLGCPVPLARQTGQRCTYLCCLEEPCPVQGWVFRKPNSCPR